MIRMILVGVGLGLGVYGYVIFWICHGTPMGACCPLTSAYCAGGAFALGAFILGNFFRGIRSAWSETIVDWLLLSAAVFCPFGLQGLLAAVL